MEDTNWEGLRNWRFTWGRALEQPAKSWKWASKPRGATRFRWKRSSQPTKPQLRRLPHNLSIKFIVLHGNRLSFVLLASFVSYISTAENRISRSFSKLTVFGTWKLQNTKKLKQLKVTSDGTRASLSEGRDHVLRDNWTVKIQRPKNWCFRRDICRLWPIHKAVRIS